MDKKYGIIQRHAYGCASAEFPLKCQAKIFTNKKNIFVQFAQNPEIATLALQRVKALRTTTLPL